MTQHHSRGFTLIELLMVIAIIGILSAIVLTSLATARNEGKDAEIQGDLRTIRVQAEAYFEGVGNGTYGAAFVGPSPCTPASGMFVTDTQIKNALADAKSVAKGGVVQCIVKATSPYAFIIQAQLNAQSGYWCVDSNGNAKVEPASLGAGTYTCS